MNLSLSKRKKALHSEHIPDADGWLWEGSLSPRITHAHDRLGARGQRSPDIVQHKALPVVE